MPKFVIERGNPRASGARFVDYWMGAGAWAAMPEPRREALPTAMSTVKAEWDAAFRNPTLIERYLTDGPTTPTEQTRRNRHGKCDPDEHPLGGDAEAFRRPGSGLRPGQPVL